MSVNQVRQMRDAAVKVCRTEYDSCDKFGDVDGRSAAKSIAEAIAALPVPEANWRDLTIDELRSVFNKFHDAYGRRLSDGYEEAVIAKFKEKNSE